MAIRSIVESDLSGKPDAATATFGLGDTWYEVDLTPEERKKLEEALEPYLKVGRKARQAAPTKKRVVPKTTIEERDVIRAWAKKNGYELAERGRIPRKIMKAYDEAHGIDRSK
ncbi:histone-like nucleoid-structuring protein Lsr2 [Streptomyces halstedii]|uniref:Lsr2 family protein n=1 Tax=Streptomyces halstedii TaxID=1944 RepID=A0A6N9U560_STRHA|nr:Lsr2 family protein [Streptomyces halstedii]NEA18981.1 Lsr2 family protein [Streptomyces halstedii]